CLTSPPDELPRKLSILVNSLSRTQECWKLAEHFLNSFNRTRRPVLLRESSRLTCRGVHMIKNERQYRITKSQADKFERALAQIVSVTPETAKLHPLLVKAQREALTSQLTDLNQQLADYDSLRS